jgi:hypothetical protein
MNISLWFSVLLLCSLICSCKCCITVNALVLWYQLCYVVGDKPFILFEPQFLYLENETLKSDDLLFSLSSKIK